MRLPFIIHLPLNIPQGMLTTLSTGLEYDVIVLRYAGNIRVIYMEIRAFPVG